MTTITEKVQLNAVQEIKNILGDSYEKFIKNEYFCKNRKEYEKLQHLVFEAIKFQGMESSNMRKVKIFENSPYSLVKYHKYVGQQVAKHLNEKVESCDNNDTQSGILIGIETNYLDHYAVLQDINGNKHYHSFFNNLRFADGSFLYPKEDDWNIVKLITKWQENNPGEPLELFTPLCGYVRVIQIKGNFIITDTAGDPDKRLKFYSDGCFATNEIGNVCGSECVLFPTHSQRNWKYFSTDTREKFSKGDEVLVKKKGKLIKGHIQNIETFESSKGQIYVSFDNCSYSWGQGYNAIHKWPFTKIKQTEDNCINP